MENLNVWEFLAGLGLFLYGIHTLEAALKTITGRKFKLLLHRYTNNPLNSVLVGTVSTMILQSSSAVTLMLIALVGSGALIFPNAVGIILGANLGTTFTGWIVSTFGFKVNIGQAVLPMIAGGTLIYVFSATKKLLNNWGKFFVGLGLLFYGLGMMKTSVETLQNILDFESLRSSNIYLFAVGGFIFTAIVQSSSATMAITLTALHAQLLPLDAAAALVVGADLGTTITAMIGATGGSVDKKRVAAAHFFFNLSTAVFALVALKWLLMLGDLIIGDSNPLYSLVLFQSSFNIIGIMIFLPFLSRFSKFIENFVSIQKRDLVGDIDPTHTEAALIALQESSKQLVKSSIALNASPVKSSEVSLGKLLTSLPEDDFIAQYKKLKETESLILTYLIRVQEIGTSKQNSESVRFVTTGIHKLSYSRKSLKDIAHNFQEFKNSSNPTIYNLYLLLKTQLEDFYHEISHNLQTISESKLMREFLQQNLLRCEAQFEDFSEKIEASIRDENIPQKHISNLFNVNRELFTSHKLLMSAIQDIWIGATEPEVLGIH